MTHESPSLVLTYSIIIEIISKKTNKFKTNVLEAISLIN